MMLLCPPLSHGGAFPMCCASWFPHPVFHFAVGVSELRALRPIPRLLPVPASCMSGRGMGARYRIPLSHMCGIMYAIFGPNYPLPPRCLGCLFVHRLRVKNRGFIGRNHLSRPTLRPLSSAEGGGCLGCMPRPNPAIDCINPCAANSFFVPLQRFCARGDA